METILTTARRFFFSERTTISILEFIGYPDWQMNQFLFSRNVLFGKIFDENLSAAVFCCKDKGKIEMKIKQRMNYCVLFLFFFNAL